MIENWQDMLIQSQAQRRPGPRNTYNDTINESREGDRKQNLNPNVLLFQVDQDSLRGYLKELSKEPHIAAGRRDK